MGRSGFDNPYSSAARPLIAAALGALAAVALLLALATPAEAGFKGKAKRATKAAISSAELEPVQIKCRILGKRGRNGVRCKWVAAERRGARTYACRGKGDLRSPRSELRFSRDRCKQDRGGTRATASMPERLRKRGLEATDSFCWGLLGRGFHCRYEAIRYADRTYDCRGTAKLNGKRFKLGKRRCSVNGPATTAQGAVAGSLAKTGLEPAGAKCRTTASGGWSCDWRATESSGGWTYHCDGAATATAATGPFELDPCRLRAPELSPLGAVDKGQHFGANEDWGSRLGEIPRAAKAGSDTLRVNLGWSSAEPKPGDFRWTFFDAIYNRMLASGIRPLFVLGGAPCWATGSPSCRPGQGTHPPSGAHDGAWRDFVARVAQRYPQARALEIWNEPNDDTFYAGGPNPSRYAQLLKLARQSVDSVGGKQPVLFGGLAPHHRNRKGEMRHDDFLRKALAAGAAGQMDAIAHHAYSGRRLRDGHTEGLREQLADLKDVMLDFEAEDVPLWVTEVGVSTAERKIDEREQAKTLKRAYKTLRKTPGVDAVIVHRWRDQKGKGKESGYGLTTRKGKAKQALCKLAKMRGRACPK